MVLSLVHLPGLFNTDTEINYDEPSDIREETGGWKATPFHATREKQSCEETLMGLEAILKDMTVVRSAAWKEVEIVAVGARVHPQQIQ